MSEVLAWSIFGGIVLILLVLDLGVFHRKAHEVKMREALIWSAVWIAVASLFNLGIYWLKGKEPAMQFLAGYILEKSLSVDNLFVFLLVFKYFHLPGRFQHKILFWGILGALVTRGIFIALGLEAIRHFHWIIYVFGVILIWTGVKLVSQKDQKVDPEKNIFLKGFRKIMRITELYDEEGRFFIRKNGFLFATPLIAVLIVIETTDVVFAVDSIPAILSISRDPFIVYTSNVFAILGLRALYFALAGLMRLFHHLHYGLSLILVLIGFKMLLSHFYHIPTAWTLGTILFILVLSVIASIVWPLKSEEFTNG
ncbi:MAG: TerC family protein [Candidatus Omnitrophota bacterium]